MADRHATLIADEGMRILNSNLRESKAPHFLASNDDLWEAWRVIQARGYGERRGSYWRITSEYLSNEVNVMRLEIYFTKNP